MTEIVSFNSGRHYASGDHLQVKFKIISGASNGDNTVVAAVTGAKIRVLSLAIVTAGAVTVRFESGAGGTALTGVMSMPANGIMVLGHDPHGHFETAAAELLNMELGGAVQVSGSLTYIEVV